MGKERPFFEFCFEPELDTFSDDDFERLVRNPDRSYIHIAWYHTHYKVAKEFASNIDPWGSFGRPAKTTIKRCVISFDEGKKLQIKVDYRETWQETYNYYPESLHECFVVLEFIVSNLYWQLTNIYHKGKKPLDPWTVYERWQITDIYPLSPNQNQGSSDVHLKAKKRALGRSSLSSNLFPKDH